MGIFRYQLCGARGGAGPVYVSQVQLHRPTRARVDALLLNAIAPSGITSGDGEQCLVTGASGVTLEPCLEAIAAGDGREVLQFDKERVRSSLSQVLASCLHGPMQHQDGQITSMADGSCVVLADGDT